jgi:AbrB family looped-hinge helix DNA binding protein
MPVILWHISVSYMLTDRMRVGPKGQVVIPKRFRKVLKVGPGSEIVFRLEGESVILEREAADPVRTLGDIARKGKSVSRINPHAYEAALEERNR